MMFRLVIVTCVLLLVSYSIEISEVDTNASDDLKSIFEGIGFSASCVSKALSVCEQKEAHDSLYDNNKLPISKMENQLKYQNLNEMYPENCADILKSGNTQSGIQIVYLHKNFVKRSVSVVCDHDTDGGGWTVIQYRCPTPIRENFFRKWTEYKLGFGNLSGEFWLGLDNIHALVSDTLMELRVDLEDHEGNTRRAKYEYFYISDESGKYKLDLGSYSGDAGDGLTPQSGQKFTTKDQDNDVFPKNCAQIFKGAWWYGGCHTSNLNGLPHKGNHSSFADGINWYHYLGHHYSLKQVKLSLRPKFT